MVRTPDEVEAQAQQAKKEVRFDLQDLAKLDINEDKVPKTRMRRKSLEAPVFQEHEDDRRTSTLHEDEEEAPPKPLEGAYDDFKEYNDQEVFDDSRYRFEAGHYDDEDLNARLESLAEMYGRKGKSPGFPFTPLTPEGKAAYPEFNGIMDQEAFLNAMKNPTALFNEIKLRSLMVLARTQQVKDLHRTAKKLDGQQATLYHWCHTLGLALDEQKEKAGLREKLTAAVQQGTDMINQLVEQNQLKEDRIRELEAALSDMCVQMREERTRRRETPTDREDPVARDAVSRREREDTPMTQNTSGTGGSGGRSAKLDGPPIYYRDATKDTVSFEVWYRQLGNKLVGNHDWFADDRTKQGYIEGRLGGKAAQALQPYLSKDHPERISTSEELLKHLWEEYHDPNTYMKALRAYDNLTMEADMSYGEFRAEFVRLAGEARKPKSDWKAEFHRRLSGRLQTALAEKFLDPLVTFDAMAKYGTQMDMIQKNAYAQRDEAKKDAKKDAKPTGSGNGSGNGGNRRGEYRGGGNRNGATPANNNPTPRGDRPRIPVEKLKRLIAEGRCFNCEQTGHMSDNCPSPKTARPMDRDREARIAAILDRWGDTSATSNVAATSSSEAVGTTDSRQARQPRVSRSQPQGRVIEEIEDSDDDSEN